MSVSLGTVHASITLDLAGLKKGIATAKGDFAKLAQELHTTTGDMARQMGRNMTMAGAAMAAGLGVAAKAAGEFDQALRNVNSLAKLSEGEFQKLRKDLLSVVADPAIRQGPKDLAEGLYDVYSSGFQGKKAMDVLRQSAYGASAGMTDTATASRVLMAVLNSGVKGVNNAREAMDVLFREVDLGVNTFSDLAGAIGDVLPMAKVAGVSLQEVSAALAVMTRRGINVNEATTALNQMLTQIVKPGKDAAKLMDSLGISYGVAALQAKGLTGVMEEIIAKTAGNKQQLVEIMPEIRAMKALLSLTDEGGRQYTEMLKGMESATQGAGSTQKALTEQNKGAAAQWELLRKELQLVAIEAGDALLPTLKSLSGELKSMLSHFNAQPKALRDAEVHMAAWGAATLVVVGVVTRLAAALGTLRTALNVLAGSAAWKAMVGLAAGPAGVIGAGAAAIGGTAYLVGESLPSFPSPPTAPATRKQELARLAWLNKTIAGTRAHMAEILRDYPAERIKQIQDDLAAHVAEQRQLLKRIGAAVSVSAGRNVRVVPMDAGGAGGGTDNERLPKVRRAPNGYRRTQIPTEEELLGFVDPYTAMVEAMKDHTEAWKAEGEKAGQVLGANIMQSLRNLIPDLTSIAKNISEVAEFAAKSNGLLTEPVSSEVFSPFDALRRAAGGAAPFMLGQRMFGNITSGLGGSLMQTFETITEKVPQMLADAIKAGKSRADIEAAGRVFGKTFAKMAGAEVDVILMDAFQRAGNYAMEALGGWLQDRLGKALGGAVESYLQNLVNSVPGGGIAFGLGYEVGGWLKNLFHFADGGIAPAGQWSIVGERGPELIRPTTAMQVLPNGVTPGGGNVAITISGPITVGSDWDVQRLAERLAWHTQQQMRARA